MVQPESLMAVSMAFWRKHNRAQGGQYKNHLRDTAPVVHRQFIQIRRQSPGGSRLPKASLDIGL